MSKQCARYTTILKLNDIYGMGKIYIRQKVDAYIFFTLHNNDSKSDRVLTFIVFLVKNKQGMHTEAMPCYNTTDYAADGNSIFSIVISQASSLTAIAF